MGKHKKHETTKKIKMAKTKIKTKKLQHTNTKTEKHNTKK